MDYNNDNDIEKSDGFKVYDHVANEVMETEEKLRLQCAEYATRHPFFGDPHILAVQLYNWIKTGEV